MNTIPETMKACVLEAYGKLAYVDLPVPKPGPGEVLCKIGAVAICGSDPKMIEGHYANVNWPPYFPFVMGHEWAGEVVAVGEHVDEFKVGDRVAGEAHRGCGACRNCLKGDYTVCLNYGLDGTAGKPDKGHRHYGFAWQGANAEYNVYKVSTLTPIPDHLSFEEAAMNDTAGVAFHGIDLTGITAGGTTVVIGPGPIGLCAVQIAKGLGAGQVIAVGRGARLELARELGATHTIDYEKDDPTAEVMRLTDGVGADEIIESSGANHAPSQACDMAKKTGKIALVANYRDDFEQFPMPLNKIVFNELKIYGAKANPNVSRRVVQFLSNGVINGKKMISHVFPLSQYEEAVRVFTDRSQSPLKVVVKP